ncbi:uncharacterized protein PGTG_22679, partial [Puccinia graminis f. sp. tritici CRL 75-36-700-3]
THTTTKRPKKNYQTESPRYKSQWNGFIQIYWKIEPQQEQPQTSKEKTSKSEPVKVDKQAQADD